MCKVVRPVLNKRFFIMYTIGSGWMGMGKTQKRLLFARIPSTPPRMHAASVLPNQHPGFILTWWNNEYIGIWEEATHRDLQHA